MSDRVRKREDEMLITHLPPTEKAMAGGDDPGRVRAALATPKDLAGLQSQLRAAQTAGERRAIIQSIQERFGNDAAEEVIREARLTPLPGDESGNGGAQ